MNQKVQKIIIQAKSQFQCVDSKCDDAVIEIYPELCDLLQADEWSTKQLEFFKSWLKKLDVAKNHYQSYQANWTLSTHKAKVTQKYYDLTLVLIIKHLEFLQAQSSSAEQRLKIINVAFKVLDLLDKDSKIDLSWVDTYLHSLLQSFQINPIKQTADIEAQTITKKILPVTVLFWEGPIARAYLETIKSMGLKVKKIIKLVSAVDLINKKPIGKFLPQSMRTNYAANKQYKQIFYWPNFYRSKHSDAVKMIQSQVSEDLGFNKQTLESAIQNLDLQTYSENVETLSITGLRDEKLANHLKAENTELFLFTGGGIVPNNLLSLPNKQMIHIHPGFLPDIRGADCVLWSQLTTGRLSASAFFLAPGIDVGDIIHPAWLPVMPLKFPEPFECIVKYRMVYGFLDPWVRSYVLKQTIIKTNGFDEISETPQNEAEGMTYHFMHDKMVNKTLSTW